MKRDLKIRLGLFAVAVLAALYGFSGGMFGRVAAIFNDAIEDMSFGWYVPVFSAYLLWRDRAALKRAAAEGAPSWAGALLSVPFVALALVGSRGLQVRFEIIAFAGLAVTMPWAFFGRRVARTCLFPAAYLLFAVPVSTYLDFFTVHLRLFASGVALSALNGLGFDAVQQGTAIVAGGAHPFSIDVAEPCSGLRSLMALTALTAAYARLTQPTWTRRAALFACAMPLAVAGNVTRIVTICAVAAFGTQDFALGFYHDYSGYVVFIVAIMLMVAAGETIARLAGKPKERPAEAAAPAPAVGKAALVSSAAFAAAFVAAFAFLAKAPVPRVAEPPVAELPADVGNMRGDGVRYCQDEQCGSMFLAGKIGAAAKCPTCGGDLDEISLGEKTVLPGDTRIAKRVYVDASGRSFLVSLVFGGLSKSSIHRPELCLPAQGFRMSDMRDFVAGGVPFHSFETRRGAAPAGTLAYTFFNQDGFRTSSHARRILVDVWDRSVRNRIDRWAMLTVHAVGADAAATEKFLGELARSVGLERKEAVR